MLDFATQESAIETKRRELASMIAEGRQVVAALSERQTALGHKIDEALDGIKRLQEQVNAIDIVMGLVDHRNIAFQAPRPAAPVLEVVSAQVVPSQAMPTPETAPSPSPFKPMAYLRCVADGHDFMNSRAMPGQITCRRCRMRRNGG